MAETSDRPNILFLMSDQHRADVAGYEDNPVVRTPTLDRLAAMADGPLVTKLPNY